MVLNCQFQLQYPHKDSCKRSPNLFLSWEGSVRLCKSRRDLSKQMVLLDHS